MKQNAQSIENPLSGIIRRKRLILALFLSITVGAVYGQTISFAYDADGNMKSNRAPTAQSNDATLSELIAVPGILTPQFAPDSVNYTVSVTTRDVIIMATPNHSGASVSGAGSYPLTFGMNRITVEVTAEDGTERYYTVGVTRSMSVTSGIYEAFNAEASSAVTGINPAAELVEATEVKVYPNPAEDLVKIESEETITGIEITDLMGKLLSRQSFNAPGVGISIGGYPKGQYLLRITTLHRTVVRKIVKN